jgi:hypothetical protein
MNGSIGNTYFRATMVKKSAKSPKAKPAKNRTTAKKAINSRKGESHASELRSAAKASAARRLKK